VTNRRNTNQTEDLPPASYVHREGSYLREVLKTLLQSEHLQTFRDPLSPEWEIPPEGARYWHPDQWTQWAHAWEGHSGLTGAGSPALGWDEESLARIWLHQACSAWAAGDVACRWFVAEVASVRLDAWNHGDKRRGKDRTASNLGIALTAIHTEHVTQSSGPDCGMYARQPSARELAREIEGFREDAKPRQPKAARPGAPVPCYSSAEREQMRCAQAVGDAGAALAGMVAARRLLDRDAWIQLTRRALCGVFAVFVSLEAKAAAEAGHAYPEGLRRQTARMLVRLTMGNRGRRMTFDPATFAPLVRDCFAATPEAEAARLRGFEHDQIRSAPAWALLLDYSPAELEEVPRTLRGESHSTRTVERDHGAAQAERTETGRQRYAKQRGLTREPGAPPVERPKRPKKPAAKPPNRRTCRHEECTAAYQASGNPSCLRIDDSRGRK